MLFEIPTCPFSSRRQAGKQGARGTLSALCSASVDVESGSRRTNNGSFAKEREPAALAKAKKYGHILKEGNVLR
jgi:hypothetical protein